jgi:hypothetical protein
VVEQVEALPGVESASVARVAVMTGGGRVLSLLVEGTQGLDNRSMSEGGGVVSGDPTQINANVVGPRFFETLGIGLLSGRDFSDQDREGQPPVIIVNEAMVKMHFAGVHPIGGASALADSGDPGARSWALSEPASMARCVKVPFRWPTCPWRRIMRQA